MESFLALPPGDSVRVITCQLTKLETALEQVRKAYPKLGPTDAALVASALSLAGRHAVALYDGEQYSWPEDYSRLTKALSSQMEMVQDGLDTVKKSKTAPEEEPINISVGLAPNISAGERQLSGFDNLKAVLSDAIQQGVEFNYHPSDIMWQCALDRANWSTIAGRDISRRVKVRASFTEGAVGIEIGAGGPKKRSKPKVAAAEVEAEVEALVEPEFEIEAVPEVIEAVAVEDAEAVEEAVEAAAPKKRGKVKAEVAEDAPEAVEAAAEIPAPKKRGKAKAEAEASSE